MACAICVNVNISACCTVRKINFIFIGKGETAKDFGAKTLKIGQETAEYHVAFFVHH